jgi:hypothetical protein
MLQMADARTSGTAVTRIFSILEVNGRDETKAFDYMKKLRPNVQLYTKSGGGGTLPVGLGQAGGGIFFIVDALDTKAKGYDVTISFPNEGIGTAAEGIALIKGAKNPELGKKLIDWATSPAMQGQFAKYKFNFVPANPAVALEPSLAEVLKGAKLFPIDADYAGANRKRIVERWGRRSAEPVAARARCGRRRVSGARGRPRSLPQRSGRRRDGACAVAAARAVRRLSAGGARRADAHRPWPLLDRGLAAILTDRHQIRAFWNSLLLGASGRPDRHRPRVPVCVHRGARTPAALGSDGDRRDRPAAARVAAVHDRHAMIFSFGPRVASPTSSSVSRGVTVYGLTSTLVSEALTVLSIAYLTLRADPRGDRLQHRRDGVLARRVALARLSHGDAAARDPGTANAFLLLFAASLADFATPLILAGNQFPGAADAGVPADHRPLRSARRRGAVVRAARACARVFLLQRYWVSRRFYVTVTGKGAGRRRSTASPAARERCSAAARVALVDRLLLRAAALRVARVALGANHASRCSTTA